MILSFILLALLGDPGSLTITGPGITYHGKLDAGSYDIMKHKLGENAVAHPVEIGLIYRKGYFQANTTYLKDCFGHHSGLVLLGPKYDFNKYFSAGIVAGTFVRESMFVTRVPFSYTGRGVDVMPMGGFTFTATLPITKPIGVEANTLINGYINHGTLGLKISF